MRRLDESTQCLVASNTSAIAFEYATGASFQLKSRLRDPRKIGPLMAMEIKPFSDG
jgi:hypothetical protein